jgi:hypothetical protein
LVQDYSKWGTPHLLLPGYTAFLGKDGREPVLEAGGCDPGPNGLLHASCSQDTPLSQVKRAGNRFLQQVDAVQDQVVDSIRLPVPGYAAFLVKGVREPVLAGGGCSPGPPGGLHTSCSQDTPLSQVKTADNRLLEMVIEIQDQVVDSTSPAPRILSQVKRARNRFMQLVVEVQEQMFDTSLPLPGYDDFSGKESWEPVLAASGRGPEPNG